MSLSEDHQDVGFPLPELNEIRIGWLEEENEHLRHRLARCEMFIREGMVEWRTIVESVADIRRRLGPTPDA